MGKDSVSEPARILSGHTFFFNEKHAQPPLSPDNEPHFLSNEAANLFQELREKWARLWPLIEQRLPTPPNNNNIVKLSFIGKEEGRVEFKILPAWACHALRREEVVAKFSLQEFCEKSPRFLLKKIIPD